MSTSKKRVAKTVRKATKATKGAKAPSDLRVVLNTEGLKVPVSAARLREACAVVLTAQKVKHALVSITLLTPRRMAAMNKKHLDHAGPTDVITFAFRDADGAVIGDVYICPAVATANAKHFGVSAREELLRLTVHATLHVLGYEHPEGEARMKSPMWKLQERLLAKVGAK
jgi:probable rRNA maturation factor